MAVNGLDGRNNVRKFAPVTKIDAREELAANYEGEAKVAAIHRSLARQMEEAAVAAKVAGALADEVGVKALKDFTSRENGLPPRWAARPAEAPASSLDFLHPGTLATAVDEVSSIWSCG